MIVRHHYSSGATGTATAIAGQSHHRAGSGQAVQCVGTQAFLKIPHWRYKRIRKRVKGRCNKELYDSKVAQLALLKQRSERGEIELLYGDETQVSEEGYVPYGWQCKGEQVAIGSAKGGRINCLGLLGRDNDFVWKSSRETITADFVIEQLDRLSWYIPKHTVVVLDNARVHQNKKMKAMQQI